MEKLKIKNFGGIDNAEIMIREITILIGPQASGKSIIAKLLYFFKKVIPGVYTQVIDGKGKREIDKELKERFHRYFPKNSWNKGDFYINYSTNKSWIKTVSYTHLTLPTKRIV